MSKETTIVGGSFEAVFNPVITDALIAAGREALRIRIYGALGVEEKTSPQDIVTEADKAVERLLVARIAEQFPQDGIMGEEGATRNTENGRVWYLDPIDGTTNFAAGSDFFGISAGRFDADGRPEIGAIHFPALANRPTVYAVRGGGALHRSDRVERIVTPLFDGGLSEALVSVGLTKDKSHIFAPLHSRARNVVAFGSFVYEAMLVAEGKLAAYVHTGATIFDVAAAVTVCREAGCLVSGIHTVEVDFAAKRIPIMITRGERLTSELREVFVANWMSPDWQP
ncbi:MAG: inositol monophosphatase family protein [Patescibacteria group bacterium]